jgi:hypothetical protein
MDFRKSPACALVAAFCYLALAGAPVPAAERAEGPVSAAQRSGEAQRRAAEEYLAALAAGDARLLAQSIHEEELRELRTQLIDAMRLEADRNESLTRTRLFGAGMSLAELERLTPQNFFAQLAARLRFGGREFDSVDWLGVVADSGSMVQIVGRLRPRKEQGEVRVPVLVSLVPWGKDWKAALPLELQAQIDDLRRGRVRAPAPAGAAAPAAASPQAATQANPQAVLELLAAAEANLAAARCEDYYDNQMSPNFRRTTGRKALQALVAACVNRETLREQLLVAIRHARGTAPRYEYAGTRAVYDLTGQGLPFATLVLEQVDKRWYIAE